MGQSLTTPLSLTLQHWRDVQDFANNQSVEVRKRRWVTFCSSEWPTFNVGWPRDGTFDLNIISQVKSKMMDPGPHGHPDQVAYIVTWEAMAYDPPPWAKPFVPPKPLLPPSAPTLPPPVSSSPAGPPIRSSLYPTLTDPSKTKPPPPQVLPAGDDLLVDLLTEDPPPYREQALPPQVADSTDENEGPAAPSPAAPSPMAARLRGRRDQQLAADSTSSQAFPLRTGGNGQLQYWPFSSSDLYNWKNNNPSFSEDPVRLTALIESVLITHQPTWDDCQQLLQTLLTSEEKQRVLLEARKAVRGADGRPTQLPNEIDAAFPLERPNWDFTTQEGRNHLILYRQLLIAGLHGAGRRPTNLAKVKQVLQGPGETPSAFLEQLKEAYRRYTPYDPEDPGQETSVAMSFIWQSAPDIKRRLERLENLRESSLRDLLKEAERIFNKRETPEEREDRLRKEAEEREDRRRTEAEEKEKERDRKRHKEMSKLLATVVSSQRQGRQEGDRRGPLGS
ncbi:LOW QUALITY PROTEIN: uncharacterized protein LOC119808022 [Arvicola amphibius]|uniref:LOW QUALITY PROTEIN: uncharacterized protein LOC119808022 n=1 Tax=Arvicola amphibius TaxID=1047088 RepID=UPI0018E30A61|nr:LOW QUALITY PROTEIN: uncharacterized protein LOC119808022 [Arvicola amphibius]